MRLRNLREPAYFGGVLLLLSLIPMGAAVVCVASDLLVHTRYFGANPVKAGEHFLGDWTLRLLLLTLAVTPLRWLTGWVWLTRHRRKLGLLTFAYLMLHWLVYVLLDVQLDWHDLLKDLFKRPYIMIGMGALILMLPLAMTSTLSLRRRLGRHWQSLHRLIYLIAIAGVIHFWMSVKKDYSEPLFYACLLAALLVARFWPMQHRR